MSTVVTSRVMAFYCAPCSMPVMENRIKELRKQKGWTQEQLGDALGGIERGYVSRYENNKIELNVSWIQRFADALGVSPNEITGSSEEKVSLIGKVDQSQILYFDSNASAIAHRVSDNREDKMKYKKVALPKGTEPLRDLVALEVADKANWPWLKEGAFVFYQHAPAKMEDCVGDTCVVKVAGGKSYIATVMAGSAYGRYTLMFSNGAPMDNVDIEWASPIISIKR